MVIPTVIFYQLINFVTFSDQKSDSYTQVEPTSEVTQVEYDVSCNNKLGEPTRIKFEDDYLIYNEFEVGSEYEEESPYAVMDSGGSIEDVIDGARITKIEDHPYAVAIFKENNFHCGGTLVSHEHIITAAHCVTSQNRGSYILQPTDEFWIRIGTTYFDKGGRIHYVKSISVHPEFSHNSDVRFYRDLAIITTEWPTAFDQRIRPAEIHPALKDEDIASMSGQQFLTVGWGNAKQKGVMLYSHSLRETEINKITSYECQTRIRETLGLFDNRVQICSMVTSSKSCLGDSGSGLFLKGKLFAVTSWGLGCAYQLPAIYARSDNALSFIYGEIKPRSRASSPNSLNIFLFVSAVSVLIFINKLYSLLMNYKMF